jgi:hypothetical protein
MIKACREGKYIAESARPDCGGSSCFIAFAMYSGRQSAAQQRYNVGTSSSG